MQPFAIVRSGSDEGPTSTVYESLVKTLTDKRPSAGSKKDRPTEQAPREALIERLHLSGQFAGGQLRLDEPLSLNSSEMQGTLKGSIGLAGTLSLTGDLELKPQAIAAATKGQLVLAGPVPLRVRISGQQSAPQIELLELDRTVRELVRQRLRGLLPRP